MAASAKARPISGRPAPRHRPVEPKPPSPRTVSSRASVSRQAAWTTGGDQQLGDPIAAVDDEGLGPEVDQDHLHLAPIVGVDRARSIEAGDAVAERQAGTRPHLALEAGRDGHGEAGRHGVAVAGMQGQRLVLRHRGAQIHAGGVGALVGRQRQVFAVRQAFDGDLDAHFKSPMRSSAMRAARRRATSVFDARGQ